MRKWLNICVTLAISACFIVLAIFVFGSSYVRIISAFKDFGLSFGFYFGELLGLEHNITPTVNDISGISLPQIDLPQTAEGFINRVKEYFNLLFNSGNFIGWLGHISGVMGNFAKVILVVLPCFLLLGLVIKALYRRGNNNYGKDTIPLRIFKGVSRFTYQPIKSFIRGYAAFICAHRWILVCWLIIWAANFNLITIAVEFFAYYFYFAITYDFSSLYLQFVKLISDLSTPFKYFPWWGILPLAVCLFDRFRKGIAFNRLRHNEAKNCGFINELPIVSMSCGSMGKKKTTLITDMVLSQEVMFLQKALEILQNADMKFPYFPWIKLEKKVQTLMDGGTIYNLATAKEWIKGEREKFEKGDISVLYGYDFKRYGMTFDNALGVQNIFEVLETYAQAYFIYIVQSSLIVSNYSIRTDNALIDDGNFPLWLTDFFPKHFRCNSRHSKILDFDILRLGKKVMESNPNAGSFEFGVIAITEIGKERGNNLELSEVKKTARDTNQKNDLFNSWLKMCRHSATVDHFPFIKVFTDEQRPESWGADARDLCDVINIISCGERRLALPFYTIEEMLSEWAFNKFINLYYDFRFRRGDNTLLVHILKSVTAFLWRRNLRIYNRFGYSVLKIEKERGTMDGKTENKKYYLMNAKIYAKRFSTDCFSDYFNDLARRSHTGLADYLEYATEKASVTELQAQNSYFINLLYGGRS